MFKTRYAVVAVAVVLAILVGLLIAVRVSAPTDMEAAALHAAVIFASEHVRTYPVSVVVPDEADRARAALIDKMFSGAADDFDIREEYLYSAPQPQEPVVMPIPHSQIVPVSTTTVPHVGGTLEQATTTESETESAHLDAATSSMEIAAP